MNNQQLRKLLHAEQQLAPSEQAKQKAFEASMTAYREQLRSHQSAHSWPEERKWWQSNKWSFAFGGLVATAFCGVLAWVTWPSLQQPTPQSLPQDESIAKMSDIKMLSNLKAMFPNRLQAVVTKENGEYELVLAQEDRQIAKQPIVLVVSIGSIHQRIITFSGEKINLTLPNGKRLEVEVMINGDGLAFLVGPDFVIIQGQKDSHLGIEFRAEPLPQVEETI